MMVVPQSHVKMMVCVKSFGKMRSLSVTVLTASMLDLHVTQVYESKVSLVTGFVSENSYSYFRRAIL